MVQKVDEQPLDVTPVVVLVGHDHQVPVPQALGVRIHLAVLQPENLLHVVDLRVVLSRGGSQLPSLVSRERSREHLELGTGYRRAGGCPHNATNTACDTPSLIRQNTGVAVHVSSSTRTTVRV